MEHEVTILQKAAINRCHAVGSWYFLSLRLEGADLAGSNSSSSIYLFRGISTDIPFFYSTSWRIFSRMSMCLPTFCI